jgi:glycosyltransferase involved in cell wall biosynthesis
MGKPILVFINNVIMNLDSPIHRMKYELLSEQYSGLMFFMKDNTTSQEIGSFKCFSYTYCSPVKRLIMYTLYCLKITRSIGHVDAIIVNDPLLPGIVGYILKRFTTARLIVEVNGHNIKAMKLSDTSWFSRLKSKLVPLVMRFIFTRADAIKFVNSILRNEFTKSFNLSQKNVRNFFDFVPSSVFSKKSPEFPYYILFAGFPYHIKGTDILIRAFNLISNQFPGIKLKIIGHCENLLPYKELACGNPAIEFNKGIPYSEVIPQFEGCLFFVLASRTEGLPRAIIDAMSAGKAVIGSRVGGIPELIQDGVNGYLFESEDYQMLAEKMKELLMDERLRQGMGDAGYQIIQKHYTPRHYLDQYKELIDSVLNSSNV